MTGRAERNRLVEENLHLAAAVARRFSGKGVEYDDLYQVAALALVKAVERYDPGSGNALSTYALPSIVGEVKNYFRDRSRAIRMPRRAAELLVKIESARADLQQELGRSPTLEELANRAGESEERVLETLAAQNAVSGIFSIDEKAGEEDEGDLASTLGTIDPRYDEVETRNLIRALMEKLPEMERRVVRLRYFEEKSQRQAAAILGVSQMTVSRAERRAVDALRKSIKDEPIG